MTNDSHRLARRWADELPRDFAQQLAAALRAGGPALAALRADAVLPASVQAARTATELDARGDGPYTAGLLVGWLDAKAAQPTLTPVWTGPNSHAGPARLTLAVVADLIAEAHGDVVLASYATIPGPDVRFALGQAADRGVAITLLLERHQDNPAFQAHGDPFPGLPARRLAWPAGARPPGASMHAKVLVVDGRTALVGSANLTGHGLERNLECGLLIRGGPVPAQLRDHLLAADGLQDVAS